MWAIFQTIKGSWLKHIITQLSALFILTATYTIALFIILSANNIKNIFNIWGKVNEATIYLKNDASETQLAEFEKYLGSHTLLSSFKYESPALAAENFNKKFKDMASQTVEAKNISQFFPAVYKVQFNESHVYESSSNTLDGFAATVTQKYSYIKEVSYGKSWLSKYEKLINGIENASWFIVLIIVMASMFVSSNVIKTVLYSKRDEIEILEFIGAGPAWIYGPHVINIVILTFMSFFSAAIINYSLYQISYNQFSQILSSMILEEIKFLSIGSILLYFILIVSSVSLYSAVSISSLMPKNRKKTVLNDGAYL